MTDTLHRDLTETLAEIDGEAAHEAAAWAVASERLDRPARTILPSQLTSSDWDYARAALGASRRLVEKIAEEAMADA